MATDLELAFKALTDKRTDYDTLFGYYQGDQPLVYSRERLREVFKSLDAKFTQNWCAVVIDSVLERLQLRQFTVADQLTVEDELNKIATITELTLEADSVHLAALVTGEAFVIVNPPDEDGEVPQPYYNDPRLCHAFYEASNPRRLRFVAKWWRDDEDYIRMTLYYPDRFEYYRTIQKPAKMSDISAAKAFEPLADEPVAPNEHGIIPVFHFRRDRRKILSELTNIITQQDAINKLIADMMVAGEYGAFRQRYIISQAEPGRKLKNAPNEIWDIPGGDGEGQPVSVGEFGVTELDNYIVAIDKFANAIAVISRTPKHYFFGQDGTPSGEALIAMEAPLNKKAQKYVDRFAVTWRKLAHFMLIVQGVVVEEIDIEPVFDRPETIQPRTEAEIRQINVASGIPLITTLRDDGWTVADIDAMEKDKAAEQEAQQTQLGTALVGAMRNFDQNGNRQPVTNEASNDQ